jgi:hypothetical protein
MEANAARQDFAYADAAVTLGRSMRAIDEVLEQSRGKA